MRTESFARNEGLESLLKELNSSLREAEQRRVAEFDSPRLPVILIVGCGRSGSTLLMQWLADLRLFWYPTNFVSRFYGAPSIGYMIQQMLVDEELDFRGELNDFAATRFESQLGKTNGWLAPSEFWYFWRRFFKFGEIQKLSEVEWEKADTRTFLQELAALESASGKPLAMKAMLFNWNIEQLNRLFEKAVILNMRRDPFFNAQSLLGARQRFYGNAKTWYSFKPPEYPNLKQLTHHDQVVGQVIHTQRAVELGLQRVAEDRRLDVTYESFCADPSATYQLLCHKVKTQDNAFEPGAYEGPTKFVCQNEIRLPGGDIAALNEAFERVQE